MIKPILTTGSMAVEEVFIFDIAEGGKDVLLDPLVRFIQFSQQKLYLLSAGRAARGTTVSYGGEVTKFGKGADRGILDEGQGPDDGQRSPEENLIGDHGAYLSAVEGIE